MRPKNRTTYEYAGQIRYCLGAAAVKYIDGSVDSKRCKVFDYSEKTIIEIEKYENKN